MITEKIYMCTKKKTTTRVSKILDHLIISEIIFLIEFCSVHKGNNNIWNQIVNWGKIISDYAPGT